MGVSNPWTEIWTGTVKWKMEWNGVCTIIANSCNCHCYSIKVCYSYVYRVLISPQRLYEQVSVAMEHSSLSTIIYDVMVTTRVSGD